MSNIFFRSRATWLVGLIAATTACQAAIDDPIETRNGLVAGADTDVPGVRVYKGLPFGAPPVGELRWREPQPVESWDGVRDASEFGNVCVQNETTYPNVANMEGSPPLSEDCLYLNVWTAADSADDELPVMVYFYGGAFTDGGGAAPVYDGTALAERGAVVVTMNYRLGPFGFLAHPLLTEESEFDSSGNYGIMDMVASLEWVQDNIEAFGGDPDNVSIFGQSAGAMAITSLMTSPVTEGLFHKAIAQSIMGGGASPNGANATLAVEEQNGAAQAEQAGLSTLEEMRALSADEVASTFRAQTMIVDNYVIPEDPAIVFAEGRQHPVDVLMGANAREMSFGGGGGRGRGGPGRGGPGRGGPPGAAAAPAEPTVDAGSARIFWVARRIAEYQRELGNSAYVYWFTQASPAPEGSPPNNPVHASEVKYVFDNLGEVPLFPDSSDAALAGASAPDQQVADLTASYWVNFARTGNPNGNGLPEWPAHEGLDTVNAAILDANPSEEILPGVEMMQTLDAQLEQQLNR